MATEEALAVTPVARPVFELTEATTEEAEAQVALVVTTADDKSLYVPVATNCWAPPTAITALAGVIAIDDNVTPGTVSTADPCLVPIVAVMFADPAATPVARPADTPDAATVALGVLSDAQLELVVTTADDASLYIAVASNCCVPPGGTVAVAGLTATDDAANELKVKVGLENAELAALKVVMGWLRSVLTPPWVEVLCKFPKATVRLCPVVAIYCEIVAKARV
jgi:hypothetical protein